MRRRLRWARAATALCLAIVLLQQLAVDSVAAGRTVPSSPRHAHRHAHHRGNGLPPPSTTPPASPPVHHAVTMGKGGGAAAVSFDAAAAEARCKSLEREPNGAGAGRVVPAAAAAPCADDDDDKRRIPTGPNPLHNR